ncbi:MAG: lipid kinase YegS [Rhodocyclaceae bacterium]|nr:MAG: lipid kinase YegS [Rhodocyclaceae bacterium]
MNTASPRVSVFLILHGKSAQDPRVREAVRSVRADGHDVEVRVTWENGDAGRFANEAVMKAQQGRVDRIVAGGGDGTVNEVFAAAFRAGSFGHCSFGILPLGTANDFARSTGIPIDDMTASLRLTLVAPVCWIDIGVLDDSPFVNLVTGGFGSQVTAETDPALKHTLGGFAYVLTGLRRARELTACRGRFTARHFSWEGSFLALAIGNGRQAGGGIQLCAEALLDDGELDLMILPELDRNAGLDAIGRFLHEGAGSVDGLKITARSPWVTFEAEEDIFINLDGETRSVSRFRVGCHRGALPIHLGHNLLLGTTNPTDDG